MDEKLKPCCNKPNYRKGQLWCWYIIKCFSCWKEVRENSWQEAIAAWNKRSGE